MSRTSQLSIRRRMRALSERESASRTGLSPSFRRRMRACLRPGWFCGTSPACPGLAGERALASGEPNGPLPPSAFLASDEGCEPRASRISGESRGHSISSESFIASVLARALPTQREHNVAPTNSRILCHSGFQFAQSAQTNAFVFNLFRTIWRVCAAYFSSQPIYFLSFAHVFR